MRVVSSYVCQTPGRGANGGLSSARAGTTTPGTPARAARPDSFVAVVRKARRFIGGTSWRVGAVTLFFDVAKHIGIPPAPQSARTIGSVSVRTLTARSPGGRDGWAFGNPIGPASSPPECRVSGTPVTTYYDGFPKAHPSLPPSTRRSGRGVVQRRTRVDYR